MDELIPSQVGAALAGSSGIRELMDDLGAALAQGATDCVMMGGGNPAHIPAMEAVWRERLGEILASPGAMEHMLGDYDPPQGKASFLERLAAYLNERCGWSITAEHIAITNGSQTACFALFNLLAGSTSAGPRRICFPMVPEYIGYADQLVTADSLVARPAHVEQTGPQRFRYHIDFDSLPRGPDIAAYCLSRPTNPTARLASDAEVDRLHDIAREQGSYLILDNAYGLPFPGVVFEDVTVPSWDRHLISTMSLSKLGLPTSRTGIVIAEPAIIQRLININAVVGLANGSIGQVIVEPLLGDRIDRLCAEIVRPFYKQACDSALAQLDQALAAACPYRIHEPGGAFFLWLWLPELRISDRELYERLKQAGLLVVPGRYFFPGYQGDWSHTRQCLRLSYCQEAAKIEQGVAILADELRRAHGA